MPDCARPRACWSTAWWPRRSSGWRRCRWSPLRFHLVSPIGILLNIPLIPLTSAALLLGGLGLVLSAVWGPLGVLPGLGRRLAVEVDPGDRSLGGRAAVGTPLRGRAGLGMGAGLLRPARTRRRRPQRFLATVADLAGGLAEAESRLVAAGGLGGSRLAA